MKNVNVFEFRNGDWSEDYVCVKNIEWNESKGFELMLSDMDEDVLEEYNENKDCDEFKIKVSKNKYLMIGEIGEFCEFCYYWFNIEKVRGKILKLGENWIECVEVSKEEVSDVIFKEVFECDYDVLKGDEIMFSEDFKYVKFK